VKRDEVIRILREHRQELEERYGVASLVLFGSMARDETTKTSDVDLLVEFNRPTGYFGLVRLQLFLQETLGRKVDLGTPGSLRPARRERILQEAVRVT
jgi:predicted nucleotidyltransferase